MTIALIKSPFSSVYPDIDVSNVVSKGSVTVAKRIIANEQGQFYFISCHPREPMPR